MSSPNEYKWDCHASSTFLASPPFSHDSLSAGPPGLPLHNVSTLIEPLDLVISM